MFEIENRFYAAGSRQAPDPYDHFLEKNGFYRKHTARDGTCMFRAISELLFDTQNHHLFVRAQCVEFMNSYGHYFWTEKAASGCCLDLVSMAKPYHNGGLVELTACAFLFKRNVVLFTPFDTGEYIVYRDEYSHQKPMMLFWKEDKHMDIIYNWHEMETLAFCQSLIYEMLYMGAFKLPDIGYAVERMLYASHPIRMNANDNNGDNDADNIEDENDNHDDESGQNDEQSYIIINGRQFRLSKSSESQCILDDFMLCNFHNKEYDRLIRDVHLCTLTAGPEEQAMLDRMIRSCLPGKSLSCVRQLLQCGITPFPYKVAKSLDPFLYRNIEFDSWNDARKKKQAMRTKSWLYEMNQAASKTRLQLGTRCLVRVNSPSQNYYRCYIREMISPTGPCVVEIFGLGVIRTVSIDHLKALPDSRLCQWQNNWSVRPNRPDRQDRNLHASPMAKDKTKAIEYHHYAASSGGKLSTSCAKGKRLHYRRVTACSFKVLETDGDFGRRKWSSTLKSDKKELLATLKQFTDIKNYQPESKKYLTMPLFTSTANKNGELPATSNGGDGNKHHRGRNGAEVSAAKSDAAMHVVEPNYVADSYNEPAIVPNGTVFYAPQPQQYGYGGQPAANYMPYYAAGGGGCGDYATVQYVPYGYENYGGMRAAAAAGPSYGTVYGISTPLPASVSQYGPPIPAQFTSFGPPVPASSAPMNLCQLQIRRKELLFSQYPVNLAANPSFAPGGGDVPVHDLPTVRFFYNLGHELYAHWQASHGPQSIQMIINHSAPLAAIPLMDGDDRKGDRYQIEEITNATVDGAEGGEDISHANKSDGRRTAELTGGYSPQKDGNRSILVGNVANAVRDPNAYNSTPNSATGGHGHRNAGPRKPKPHYGQSPSAFVEPVTIIPGDAQENMAPMMPPPNFTYLSNPFYSGYSPMHDANGPQANWENLPSDMMYGAYQPPPPPTACYSQVVYPHSMAMSGPGGAHNAAAMQSIPMPKYQYVYANTAAASGALQGQGQGPGPMPLLPGPAMHQRQSSPYPPSNSNMSNVSQ